MGKQSGKRKRKRCGILGVSGTRGLSPGWVWDNGIINTVLTRDFNVRQSDCFCSHITDLIVIYLFENEPTDGFCYYFITTATLDTAANFRSGFFFSYYHTMVRSEIVSQTYRRLYKYEISPKKAGEERALEKNRS